ncbi:MAG: hydrogenase maturation protein [Azospirillum sp.]|nr:hydrogenase maturation protein [Azospirillum sp.]
MRILLLCHAFNSLCQRLFVELRELGHLVSVEFDINDRVTAEAVALFHPDIVVAPFLKRKIPEAVWRGLPCLIVHPGPRGDRGPSPLDWAILEGRQDWGVTVLRATGDYDAGDVFFSRDFAVRPASKGSLYRHEVTAGAVAGVLAALEQLAAGHPPEPVCESLWRPQIKSENRAINWGADDTATVLRKIRSADGAPGVLDHSLGRALFLYDAHPETALKGPAGGLLAHCQGAVCRATADGAVWLGQLRLRPEAPDQPTLKLPAGQVLGESGLPEVAGDYRELWYEERQGVGFIFFNFYNGALGAVACRRLLAAWRAACARPTKILVLMGGEDFWCNGLDLAAIEAAPSPAGESWRNIEAIDDLVRAIVTTTDRLTVAALGGNAGAGGVFLALAADYVHARTGIVLNPHYKGMGNLYGSEYWTYLLPRRTGGERAEAVIAARLPMGTAEARRLGLIDAAYGDDLSEFRGSLAERVAALALDPALPRLISAKQRRRLRDETAKPLDHYRAEELERMRLNFFGFDPSYHVARYNFIFKIAKSRTPLHLASHRTERGAK